MNKYQKMQNAKYLFSSAYLKLPQELSDEIIEWGKNHISDSDVFTEPENPFLGREDSPHITILYGIHSNNHKDVFKLFNNEPLINVELKEIQIFKESFWFDVITIAIESPDLERLNSKLKINLTHTAKHNFYRPHITVAYVKKKINLGLEERTDFTDRSLNFDTVHFSSKNGTKNSFKLK